MNTDDQIKNFLRPDVMIFEKMSKVIVAGSDGRGKIAGTAAEGFAYLYIMELSRHLFWDTDPEKVDYEKHARWIIERVVTRGRLKDWREIRRYYGLEKIKEEVLMIRCLDIKTHTFLATIFNIPLEDFRCYSNRLLNHPHFPY